MSADDQSVNARIASASASLELWAGAECSMVRVGDAYLDQNALTGHDARPADIDRMAGLGVRAVRVPLLWERTWPDAERAPDWRFADARMLRLRTLGIRPIVGLVHHGSGPAHTGLLQDSFVDGLARFARCVAQRYPWIQDYTPVNEPLTTARFSGLYGHWYPHAADTPSFLRALLIQCRATRAAMRAIREVTPQARLVQTEDLGTVFATPALAAQADYENARRFLSLDLLCGRVDPAHPLHEHLVASGIKDDALASMAQDPCAPDLIGLNHYVTSDRFLDEHLDRYPAHTHGGNGRQAYADVEAVRVLGAGLPGHGALLELLWHRYGIPLAITEAHLGCASEDQVRWLVEAWNGAQAARDSGADVRAVTLWSVFGACDWDSLLTRPRGHYESGAYDVRGGAVRPTALATVARELAQHGASVHPLANDPGWWRRGIRLQYPSHGPVVHARGPTTRRPVLVTGARGTLGIALQRVCETRGLRVVALDRQQLDICDADAVRAALDMHRPWAVINAAGYVRVDQAEDDRDACLRGNARGPARLAQACAARGIQLATFSSDLVFDGRKRAPYVESDATSPLSVYGESKAQLERDVLAHFPEAMVVRTSAFFGPWDQANIVFAALDALGAGRTFDAADDALVSPTYVPDLADAVLTLLVDGAQGIWHLANAGALSWHALALRAAEAAGVSTRRLRARPAAELGLRAERPPYSVLGSERGGLMPPLEDALARHVAATAAQRGRAFERVSAGGKPR